MRVTHASGAIKRFRRTPWRFQQTVEIPSPDERPRFVSTIIAAHPQIEEATIIFDEIVFDTERVDALLPSASSLPLVRESSITAVREEIESLLLAVLMDLPDFIVVPTPKPFVIYSDHDEWITFYANTKGNLNQVIGPLAASGFKLVHDWQREL